MKGCDSVGIGYFFKILHEKVTVFVFHQLRLAESQLSTFILFPRTYIVNLVTHAIWITATSALVSAICISGPFVSFLFFFYLPVFYLICVFPGQSGHLPSCTALLFSHSLCRSFPQLSKEQKPILIVQPFGKHACITFLSTVK